MGISPSGSLLQQPARPAVVIPMSPPEKYSGAAGELGEVFMQVSDDFLKPNFLLGIGQDTACNAGDGLLLRRRVGGSRRWLWPLKTFAVGQGGLTSGSPFAPQGAQERASSSLDRREDTRCAATGCSCPVGDRSSESHVMESVHPCD